MGSSEGRPSFAVVTDSTADIPPAMAERLGITVVPLSVSFGTDTVQDGAISQEEFFARMAASPSLPTTSQPPIGAFVTEYERLLASADSVVSIHISHKLSGTLESARQAAEQFAGRVHVFDSLTLSWAMGFQVLDAVAAAVAGSTPEAALAALEPVRARVCQLVGLDSLENLRRGGRIGAVSALLGSLLDVKVMLEVDRTGEFQPVGRYRGEKAALKATIEEVAKRMGRATRGRFAVGHAMEPERAERLATQIRERWEATELIIYATGVVIATHTGKGWGVTVLPEG